MCAAPMPLHEAYRTSADHRDRHGAILKGIRHMLWAVILVLIILWLLGFIGSIGGSLIHLLLVIALIVLIVQLLSGRRAV
jgi:hypothetical protein